MSLPPRARRRRSGLVEIHQLRDLKQPRLVILGLVGRDVELGIAREHVLDAAGAIDPGDAVARGSGRTGPAGSCRATRRSNRRSDRTEEDLRPTRPSPDSHRGRWPAQRRTCRSRAGSRPPLTCASVRHASPLFPSVQRNDAGRNFALQATAAGNQLIDRAIGLVAGFQHGVGYQFHLGRTDPAVAHCHQSRPQAGML